MSVRAPFSGALGTVEKARAGGHTQLRSFFRKKKLEEEEAEVKRKATDAAYQGKLHTRVSCIYSLL